MNVKKSAKASLEDKKSIYALMGFVVVLSLIYIGLEWTRQEVTIWEATTLLTEVEEGIEIIQTAIVEPPPPPPEIPDVIEILNIVEDDVETAEITIDVEDEKDRIVVIAPTAGTGTGIVDAEDTDVPFVVVEQMPSFPGGDAALMRFLSDNIRYPVIAAESGIQGRVILQFVVNRDGSIVDIEVVRSIDRSLDAEAVRVVSMMPRWTPGKQRGRTVRVRYTLPVNFRLQ